MGHGVKHHRGSDPGPTGHEEEWCLSRTQMSSAPAQWPSTVQMVAEGPGPTSALCGSQDSWRRFTWIHPGAEWGKLMLDTKKCPGRPMVRRQEHLRTAIWRATA